MYAKFLVTFKISSCFVLFSFFSHPSITTLIQLIIDLETNNMTETIPQQLCLGFVSFLSKSGSTKNKFPLYNNSLSFGRNLKCDCRILVPTCSKEHATIFVDQSVSPFTVSLNLIFKDYYIHQNNVFFKALLKVYSSNGVVFNGKDFSKGSDIPLNTGDEFIIAERTFRWEAASIEIVNVDVSTTFIFNISLFFLLKFSSNNVISLLLFPVESQFDTH